jgi:putative nucleotidyltransferase with HDIG domain
MKRKWNAFIRAIDIPFDPFDEQSIRENLISSLVNLMILLGTVGIFLLGILRGIDSRIFHVAAIFTLVMIIARAGVQRGKSRIVSLLFLGFSWVFLTAMILLLENGLRAPVYIAVQLFLVVYAGLLHGRKAVMVISALSVIASGSVAFMELQGFFLTEPKVPDVRFSIIALFIFVPTIGFLIIRTLENLQLSISLYREESKIRYASEQQVKFLNQELEHAYETTLEGWSRALELKDKETEGHSSRVTELTIEVAKKFDFDEKALKYIYYGALLHDIGKMGIPDDILNKPGVLTPEEREIINQHPIYAFEMLKDIEYLQPAISIPYSHHENWDGTGYPQGLQGEEIPFPARIFSVVDNWDALTSDRPYRNAWSKEKTMKYIKEQSGKKFDHQVVEVFVNQIINTTGFLKNAS